MIFKIFCDPLGKQHIYLHLDIVPTYNFTATETTFLYSFHIYIYKLFLHITFTEDIFSILYFQMRQFENKFQEHSYKNVDSGVVKYGNISKCLHFLHFK